MKTLTTALKLALAPVVLVLAAALWARNAKVESEYERMSRLYAAR